MNIMRIHTLNAYNIMWLLCYLKMAATSVVQEGRLPHQ